jgi:hypothetical protein
MSDVKHGAIPANTADHAAMTVALENLTTQPLPFTLTVGRVHR